MPTLTGSGTPGTTLHDGQVQVGDALLGTTDDYGVEWVVESVRGWSDPPPSTGQVEQRAAAHGGWASPAYYTPRVIEVVGSALADTWDGAEAAVDRLFAAVPLDTLDTLQIATNSRTLQAEVRQDGDPLVEILDGHARFSLSLIAPDPRRYSADLFSASTGLPLTSGGLTLPVVLPVVVNANVDSGRLIVTNEGNMPAPAVFAVTGPSPAFAITHDSGRRLAGLEAIPAGRTLFIDTASRTALLDGTSLRVVTGAWFDLEPGDNEIQFSSSTYDPDALLSVSFRSAWR